MQDSPANTLVIEGQVMRSPETRCSPAGIPISRFVLDHQSRCDEAGAVREVRLRLGVVVAGRQLQPAVSRLVAGSWVRVEGFLARTGFRSADHRLVLHAQSMEILND
ncbi:MAG: primosomal replication protein N [Thiohalobacteraceae bacterium]|nr:primosomal replication protein N [Gammaproteobacteria bacterium]